MNKKFLLGCGVALVAFIIMIAVWSIASYNKLVTKNESVNQQWGQVENQYQRRMDLIPNLVNTVKGYAAHEKSTLEGVMNARSKATSIQLTPEALNDPKAIAKFQQVQGELSSALSRLMAVAENYPNLKANENFLQLQSQLEGTENRIARERQKYNDVVKEYNLSVKRFPSAIFAGIFGYRDKPYFEAKTGAETPPSVSF